MVGLGSSPLARGHLWIFISHLRWADGWFAAGCSRDPVSRCGNVDGKQGYVIILLMPRKHPFHKVLQDVLWIAHHLRRCSGSYGDEFFETRSCGTSAVLY